MALAEILTATNHLTTINWLTRWWADRGRLEPRILAATEMLLDGCAAR